MIDDPRNDRQLLTLARDGDARAFDVLYRRHRALVIAYLSRRVASPELAADLLAECFAALLVVVRDPERELPASAAAWLLGTGKHLLVDSYRRGKVEASARARLQMRPVCIEDHDLREIEEISAETNILGQIETQLPAEQFKALRSRVIDERDYADIARDLQCSEALVRKRVSRALTALRQRVKDGDGIG